MSTPSTTVAIQGTNATVTPSAVSSASSGAIFALGEVLKTILHKLPVFSVESDLDAAINVIDKWVGSSVSNGELSALLTGAERAAKEDVSLRIPPGGAAPNIYSGPQLDYAKLAEAILAAQKNQGAIDKS